MFRVIGGAVVYGLALYGVVKLFDRPKLAVVIQRNGKYDNEKQGEKMADAGHDGKPSADQADNAANLASSRAHVA